MPGAITSIFHDFPLRQDHQHFLTSYRPASIARLQVMYPRSIRRWKTIVNVAGGIMRKALRFKPDHVAVPISWRHRKANSTIRPCHHVGHALFKPLLCQCVIQVALKINPMVL
jgi:hypothetical protein